MILAPDNSSLEMVNLLTDIPENQWGEIIQKRHESKSTETQRFKPLDPKNRWKNDGFKP